MSVVLDLEVVVRLYFTVEVIGAMTDAEFTEAWEGLGRCVRQTALVRRRLTDARQADAQS